MPDSAVLVPLDAAPRQDAYAQVQAQLTDFLLRHALVGSYFEYRRHGRPYPFLDARAAVPAAVAPAGAERKLQRSALMLLIDGDLPKPLAKHFHRRLSNRLNQPNLQRFAPSLDLADFRPAQAQPGAPGFESLLAKLTALDYALLIERPEAEAPFRLTHFHVKVDRRTDLALAEFGRRLGYVERRLFERGEDFVDALEAKFFEYHGFGADASGRRSAAAMAAQLLAAHGLRFTVFVASQADGRLTLLTERDGVSQHLLVRLAGDARAAFFDALKAQRATPEPYLVAEEAGDPVVLYRLRFRRTEAARPAARRAPERDLRAPWLEAAEQSILPLSPDSGPVIPLAWTDDRPARRHAAP